MSGSLMVGQTERQRRLSRNLESYIRQLSKFLNIFQQYILPLIFVHTALYLCYPMFSWRLITLHDVCAKFNKRSVNQENCSTDRKRPRPPRQSQGGQSGRGKAQREAATQDRLQGNHIHLRVRFRRVQEVWWSQPQPQPQRQRQPQSQPAAQ